MQLSKKVFAILTGAVICMLLASVALLATSNKAIQFAEAIPSSTQLLSLPPQTKSTPEYTAVIANLPSTISYTDTRNIQDTLGYFANPTKKGTVMAAYREGSTHIADDGRTAFLVDVPSEKKTFVVYGNKTVACASDAQQLDPSWHCRLPEGDDFE